MTEITRDQPTAVLARRYLAHLIDVVVYGAALAVPFFLFGERLPGSYEDTSPIVDAFRLNPDYAVRYDDMVWTFSRNDLILVAAIAAGVAFLFNVIIQGRFGWTIGKLLTGIRTVDGDGERPGIIRAFFRTLLLPVDALPGEVLPLVGGFFILVTSDNRRLGDLATGTYVVGKASTGADPRSGAGVDTSDWAEVGDHDGPAPVTTLDEGEPLRVGAAVGARDDAVNEPAASTAPAATSGTDEAKPAYQPQWDPARKAYLQWDPRTEVWLQFDDDAQEWRPVD